MKHFDLFSGIGGFALAAQWAGIETVGLSEIEPFCCKVLAKNFPGIPNYGDITTLDGRTITADLITGGFPCQPFSQAGKQQGQNDQRHLWPEMLRIITESKPTYIIGENVSGFINMALEQVCADLESIGFEVVPVVIPACAVNAPHRRDRVWILAHNTSHGCRPERTGGLDTGSGKESKYTLQSIPDSHGRNGQCQPSERPGLCETKTRQGPDNYVSRSGKNAPYSKSNGLQKLNAPRTKEMGVTGNCKTIAYAINPQQPEPELPGRKQSVTEAKGIIEPGVRGMADGLSKGMDGHWNNGQEIAPLAQRSLNYEPRLRSLGNAIVPHIAYHIMQCILRIQK